MKKYKKYRIFLNGFSDSDCSSTTRMLTKRQYLFLDEMFNELMRGQGCGDYAPSIGLYEKKVRLGDYKTIDGKTVAYLENAEDVKVGQVLSYVWNKKAKKFVVEDIRKTQCGYVLASLSPNDKVSDIPRNAELETDYML